MMTVGGDVMTSFRSPNHDTPKETLPKIGNIEVTHCFKGRDCIISLSRGDLRHITFVAGDREIVHKSHLLPIKKIK